jgi:hypothetical protein
MIGRIRLRIQDRQPRSLFQLMGGMHWLWVGVALSAAAIAGPPPPPPPGTQPPPAGAQAPPVKAQAPPAGAQSPPQGTPDDDFIEFLGGDDVGDAAWWEFLKKVPPRAGNPPATPPQDAKQ